MGKKQSATNKLLKILGVLVLLFAVTAAMAKTMGWMDGEAQEKQVETAEAESRTITQIVSASGRIQPEAEVIIRPDVSGEIIELAVLEGDFVRQGDLLLRIKPDIYQAQIDELRAFMLTQQARMEQARANQLQSETEYLKNKELYDRELISELEYLQTKNGYEAEKANFRATEYQIESAQAQLRRAEEELQQTVIRAPKDGTISRLAVEQGERVLGQSQTAGTEMMSIARLDQMEVSVDVNENDIVNVTLADTADIEVDAYPNRLFQGVVTEISNSADVSGESSADQVTNYKVKIRVITPHNLDASANEMFVNVNDQDPERENQEFSPNFKPGMSGTVDIKSNTVYDVVAVPIQAVTVRDFAQDAVADSLDQEPSNRDNSNEEDFRRVVFVNDNGVAKRVEVETGISDNTHIQILSGINAGQDIVTGSYRVLSRELEEGDKLSVVDRQQLATN
ncbi:MAG: efflux RND transporter periplasmic adaptor subunit [Balneolaceae bacterium]